MRFNPIHQRLSIGESDLSSDDEVNDRSTSDQNRGEASLVRSSDLSEMDSTTSNVLLRNVENGPFRPYSDLVVGHMMFNGYRLPSIDGNRDVLDRYRHAITDDTELINDQNYVDDVRVNAAFGMFVWNTAEMTRRLYEILTSSRSVRGTPHFFNDLLYIFVTRHVDPAPRVTVHVERTLTHSFYRLISKIRNRSDITNDPWLYPTMHIIDLFLAYPSDDSDQESVNYRGDDSDQESVNDVVSTDYNDQWSENPDVVNDRALNW